MHPTTVRIAHARSGQQAMRHDGGLVKLVFLQELPNVRDEASKRTISHVQLFAAHLAAMYMNMAI